MRATSGSVPGDPTQMPKANICSSFSSKAFPGLLQDWRQIWKMSLPFQQTMFETDKFKHIKAVLIKEVTNQKFCFGAQVVARLCLCFCEGVVLRWLLKWWYEMLLKPATWIEKQTSCWLVCDLCRLRRNTSKFSWKFSKCYCVYKHAYKELCYFLELKKKTTPKSIAQKKKNNRNNWCKERSVHSCLSQLFKVFTVALLIHFLKYYIHC